MQKAASAEGRKCNRCCRCCRLCRMSLSLAVKATHALVCAAVPPPFSASGAVELFAKLQYGTYTRAELAASVVEEVTFDPPLAAADEVWEKTGSGFGGDMARVPLFELAEEPGVYVKADAHYTFVMM